MVSEGSGPVPLRIGDAERDAAVSSLQEHHVAGRLNREEFDARMESALAARTQDDLAPLFVDLPQPPAPAAAVAPVVSAARPETVPQPWQRYGVPALGSMIWPMAIFACIAFNNWYLIGVAVLVSMMVGGGFHGGRRVQLQRAQIHQAQLQQAQLQRARLHRR